MQRYHGASCTSAVNNGSIGGLSNRDAARSDAANFPLNSRRSTVPASYKLKCEKDPLSSRLGPPDFHPQTPNCPEETLNREYVQSGYRETVDGIEEARESSLTQVQAFTKPVVLKCKEAIRKCLRAINESRAQKRKAGQVYGVPLTGSLVYKPGIFPEQRSCGDETRKKWIEGLSQQHKRLRSLADHIPNGYRKKSLFEVLIRNNVPLLRATWFIKVTYINQVRPGPASLPSGASDKSQNSRTELWTKDVIDYLQYLLDEFSLRNNSYSAPSSRDRSPQMLYAGSAQQRVYPSSTSFDSEDSTLHFKWWYMVRLLQWHLAEGLLLPSLIIDWVLNQLQEKERFEILQLLLPIIYGLLETIVLSQNYVQNLAGIAIRYIQGPSLGGSDLVDNSRRAYTISALIEMLHYLMLAVPDTFVGLDCFPLLPCVATYTPNDGNFMSKVSEDLVKLKVNSTEVASGFQGRGIDAQYESVSFDHVVSTIKKSADGLAKVTSPGYPRHNVAKAIEALDKALSQGNIRKAYSYLFEDLSDGPVDEAWIAEIGPCLRSSLKWIGVVSKSFISSVFSLCEWATCDFRNFRIALPQDMKFTGRKDFSHVYIVIQLLKLKIKDLQCSLRRKNERNSLARGFYRPNNFSGNLLETFESPGPLHDILVCWIDQHEVHKGQFKCLQLFLFELIRSGIFYPQAYVRQLIVSGIIDSSEPLVDLERRKRHYQILKQLPGSFVHNALEGVRIEHMTQTSEAMQIYSNERRLLLRELLADRCTNANSLVLSDHKPKRNRSSGRVGAPQASVDLLRIVHGSSDASSSKTFGSNANVEELKELISLLLQFPSSASAVIDPAQDESQGSVKRPSGSASTKIDLVESTPGCEDCRKTKRQKVSEDKSSCNQVHSPTVSDDEDMWWVRKGSKPVEPLRAGPPLKHAKQASRGRQKTVRKTQSLAQLQAARIEGSQGASTSHVCDSKVTCPHHGTGVEADTHKVADGFRMSSCDVVSIGKSLKQLHFVERRSVSVWLISLVRQLVEEGEKNVPKVGQVGRGMPFEERNWWKLGEDELSAIIYLMDVSLDLVSAIQFLLWLLPKANGSSGFTIQSGRSLLIAPRNAENRVCEVGEAFLVSSLRRYENLLLAADLIPEALSASMNRAAATLASSGRLSGSSALVYSRCLLKRYGNLPSVVEWERNFKATCDKRLFSELDPARGGGEYGFPLGVPAGVDDPDDYLRQKISTGRLSRVGLSMRDVVQRHVEEAVHFFNKERKLQGAVGGKPPLSEKSDYGYQISQQIILGLMECIRQTGGAAQEGDPSLVSSAISAIVNNIGFAIAKIQDFAVGINHPCYPSSPASLNVAKRILQIHVTCLCLLKEALGERQSRVFEIALATESSSALAGVFAPSKASRSQFQLSPESYDPSGSTTSDGVNGPAKGPSNRATKVTAAVSALIIGAIIHGVTTLERMVSLLRLKEGLDFIQYLRSTKSSSNGHARSASAFKVENSVEVYVHWFRLLVGNCKTVSDSLVVDLLGEPSILALSRMQRMLPLNVVFPPAYSIFAFVVWKPFVPNSTGATSEDMHRLYQSLTLAISDAIKHLPFRDICLRDTQGLYDLVAADSTDAEFAAILELNGLDIHVKSVAFVPLRARLFLNSLIDCEMPHTHDDGGRFIGHNESKIQHSGGQAKLLDKLVHVLDTLQPAKFHWQWVELRLLLDEQALAEKLENRDMSLADAVRFSSSSRERPAASENENNFIEIILTRLLVRPDAVPLFSEVIHVFGRSLEDSMLMQAKWFLAGQDVLFGRKTVRQRLINIAESKGLSTKGRFWKPWGWCNSDPDTTSVKTERKKSEFMSLEEGEVVEDSKDLRTHKKGSSHTLHDKSDITWQFATERAFIELVLPCIDQSSDESRSTFASDLTKQLNNIEQQIHSVTRGSSKQTGAAMTGAEGPPSKGNTRKSMRGGSPGLARRSTAGPDSVPPSPAALRASMSLRLQFLLRVLPVICVDGEPSGRNLKHMLAPVILRLLGSRVVYDDASSAYSRTSSSPSKTEVELLKEPWSATVDLSSESLFDCLLFILHGLLSSSQPSWLKVKSASKSATESSKDFSAFDRDVVDNLQNDLERMQLPDTIRWRIQAAIPVLLPSGRCNVSCQPPTVPPSALSSLQPGASIPGSSFAGNLSPPRRTVLRSSANMQGKQKQAPPQQQQESEMEIDPWTLLEDSAGSGPSSNNAVIGGGDHSNLRAASWLKGAVRVRRSDLTYIGAIDDDS